MRAKDKKSKSQSQIDRESVIQVLRKVILALVSGIFGFALNWVFSEKIVEGLVTLCIVGVFCLSGWILTYVFESKTNILVILQKDIKSKKYQEAVKLGCAVSRALFLSSKNRERCLISERIITALNELQKENIVSVNVNDKLEDVLLLKAKIMIDDYGWSHYLCDTIKNRNGAEIKIKEGIKDCLRYSVSNSDNDRLDRVFAILFKGIRHLYAMRIENFEDMSAEELKNNSNELLIKYKSEILEAGCFLGWLLNDSVMINAADEETCKYFLLDLFPEIRTIQYDFVNKFKDWASASMQKAKFAIGTYGFRTKHCLAMARICELEKNNIERKSEYLDNAKRLALLMTVGYSTSDADLIWIRDTFTFGAEIISLLVDRSSFRDNDSERFVKGYVLLGTVAAAFDDLNYLCEANTAFSKAVEESKKVNRVDTYLRSQRKIISTNEKIFLINYHGHLKSNSELIDDLLRIQKEMKRIQSETKKFIGYSDRKMSESCKSRSISYKKILKKLKEN